MSDVVISANRNALLGSKFEARVFSFWGGARCFVLLLCLLTLSAGCGTAPPPINGQQQNSFNAANSLDAALTTLNKIDQLSMVRARQEVLYHLNSWLGAQSDEATAAASAWRVDKLVAHLPRAIREAPNLKNLEVLRFFPQDVIYFQQVVWARDISHWVAKRADRPEFMNAASASGGNLDDEQTYQLAMAAAIFDWTIRNIRLDEMLPEPEVKKAGPSTTGSAAPVAVNAPPSLQGLPGPGYQRYVWQTILFGHGDALERARVFIALARQQGIEVVMLGVEQRSGKVRPWVPAVLLNQQLFLFEPALGLPIPRANGKGIATLVEAAADPKVLDGLDLDKYKYAVRAKGIQEVVAMIDAEPESLTQRFYIVERALTGDNQMILTVAPSRIAKRLSACKYLDHDRTQIGRLPFDTIMYRSVLPQRLAVDQRLRQVFREEALFVPGAPLVLGRYAHFRGEFSPTNDAVGASRLYMQSRMAERLIRDLDKSQDARNAVGLARSDSDTDATWSRSIVGYQGMLRKVKLLASLYTGLAQYEQDKYGVAIDWLKERTIKLDPESPWSQAAAYNLARSYEALGRYDEAREIYLYSKSPQQYGDHLRASRLPRPASSEPTTDDASE